MGYLVLARKWRPQRFEDLQGQESITTILRNAITQSKIAHAYLFSGPRGVGKTSTARIMAKSLNCVEGPTALPCGKCAFCTSITDGSSVDVIEIDGASNNSVDDIRDLREKVKYAPAGGRYKVYIIDEAHMLSQSAFNALLKTLEEPPPHIVFVLATTAPNKIPVTVLSRCQHLPFKRIPSPVIRERLRLITSQETIAITERALDLLARSADGSMRDALTLLDQVSAFSAEIREDDLMALLGISDTSVILALAKAVLTADRKEIISLAGQLYEKGQDVRDLMKSLIVFLRELLVCKVLNTIEGNIEVHEEEKERVAELLSMTSEEQLTLLLDMMVAAENDIRLSGSPRVAFEMALIKASFLSRFRDIGDVIKKISSGTIPAAPAPAREKGTQKQPPLIKEKKEAVKDTVAEEPCTLTPEVRDGKDLWATVVKKIDEKDHILACKLSHASADVKDDTLSIVFDGGFSVHAEAVKESTKLIEDMATQAAARRIRIVVLTSKRQTEDIKEKILGDPLVKDALELFDGRIVDIRPRSTRGK